MFLYQLVACTRTSIARPHPSCVARIAVVDGTAEGPPGPRHLAAPRSSPRPLFATRTAQLGAHLAAVSGIMLTPPAARDRSLARRARQSHAPRTPVWLRVRPHLAIVWPRRCASAPAAHRARRPTYAPHPHP